MSERKPVKAVIEDDGTLAIRVGDDENNFRIVLADDATEAEMNSAIDILTDRTGASKFDIMLAVTLAIEGTEA